MQIGLVPMEVGALVPVISFIGRHNSGKTTVLTGVVQYLSAAGYRIAVIKHAHHNLSIEPLKDAEKLFEAGADLVVASSPEISLQYRRHQSQTDFSAIQAQIPEDMDLIIVEGYKNEDLPKIEVLRQEIDPEPMLLPSTLALISDFNLESPVAVFNCNQIAEIAEFVLQQAGFKG